MDRMTLAAAHGPGHPLPFHHLSQQMSMDAICVLACPSLIHIFEAFGIRIPCCTRNEKLS
jgi:hypothetical protein